MYESCNNPTSGCLTVSKKGSDYFSKIHSLTRDWPFCKGYIECLDLALQFILMYWKCYPCICCILWKFWYKSLKNITFYIFLSFLCNVKACNNYGLTVLHHLTTLYLAGFPLSSFSVIFQILFLILFFMSMSSYIMITAIYSQKNVLEIKVGLQPYTLLQ